MIIWGMSKNGHDWSLAVFENNNLIKSMSGKGKMHDINAVLDAFGLTGAPDLIVWYENPYLKSLRQFIAGQPKPFARNNITKYLKKLGLRSKWTYVGHHESHAAHFYNSGFEDAAVIVIDSIGEFDCTTIWSAKNNKLKKVYSVTYPESLGLFYSAMTQYIGMVPQLDEGRFEQLAKQHQPDPEIVYSIEKDLMLNVNFHKGISEWEFKDNGAIAASTQMVFESRVQELSARAKKLVKSNNLVVSGGCAFNRGIRPYLESNWDNVYIPANPSDSSSAETAVMAWLINRGNNENILKKTTTKN